MSYIININLKESEYFVDILLKECSFLFKKFKLDVIDTDFLDKCEPVYDKSIETINEFVFRKALWRTFNVNKECIKKHRYKKSRVLTYTVWNTYKELLYDKSFIDN